MAGVLSATLSWSALIKNGDFETEGSSAQEAVDWWRYKDASREPWAGSSSSNGMALHGWIKGSYGGFGQDVPVQLSGGNIFKFSIDAMAERNFSSSSNELWLKVEFWTGGPLGAKIGEASNSIYSEVVGNAGTWSTYSITCTNTDPRVDLIKPIAGGGNFDSGESDPRSVLFDNADLYQR
jgi:hypothetical protein